MTAPDHGVRRGLPLFPAVLLLTLATFRTCCGQGSAPVAPLLDGWFPGDSLNEAWESHPLLVVTHNESSCQADDDGDAERGDDIRTFRRVVKERNDIGDIVTIDSIRQFLSQTDLIHGTDYKLLTVLVQEGKVVNKLFPKTKMGVDEVMTTIERDGYSLIVESLQRRWGAVADFSRRLWDGAYINANLYLTPSPPAATDQRKESRRSAYTTHWDWVDVVVLQLAGTKLWTVAKRPTVYLSYHDQEHQITTKEMDELAKEGTYDVLLRPGDVLYIPRGFAHNASNVASHDGDAMASIHLSFTIGFDNGYETTIEALLHFALHDFFVFTHPERDLIVIKKRECPGSDQHIRRSTLLHLYLSAMARVGEGCKRGEGFCGMLRRSILSRPDRSETRVDGILANHMEKVYNDAIETYTTVPNVPGATTLLVSFLSRLQNSSEMRSRYRFPGSGPWDLDSPLLCPSMLEVPSVQNQLPAILSEFRAFAFGRYKDVQGMIEDHLLHEWKAAKEQDETTAKFVYSAKDQQLS